ncbi:ATP-binding cassette domain-containing protein [Herpetosiphon gulosus]|uniref:Vitamin B12 import ATP-binding protein BtuD n=1 Tax=Herpetosiphon gulosus TaxID=1973496 RepID=A0ABP9X4Q4_9CHLR
MAAIELAHVSKRYGKLWALRDLNLTIEAGMIGLLGPNGAGKTSLIRLLCGIFQPSEGQIRVFGLDPCKQGQKLELRRQLGYIPQHPQFDQWLSAYKTLEYLAHVRGITPKSLRQQAVEQAFEQVGLTEHANKKIRELSGGMRRRLAIAQALIHNPRLLIIDEPTVGLDPSERMRFRQLLQQLGRDRIVLIATHIVEDVMQTCQQVLILQQQVRYYGPITHLLNMVATSQQIWELETEQPLHEPQFTVAASRYQAGRYWYRVIGPKLTNYPLQPARDYTLNEAYLWLMGQTALV